VTPSERLTRALLDMAAAGLRTHCSDPTSHHLWLSEIDAERAVAAQLCQHCPVITPCRESAEFHDERFGVFGGRDFTRRPWKVARSA
jgi:hypothetical protein